jgi:hypothetical protein
MTRAIFLGCVPQQVLVSRNVCHRVRVTQMQDQSQLSCHCHTISSLTAWPTTIKQPFCYRTIERSFRFLLQLLLSLHLLILLQFQPFYRPKPGGPFVAWYHTGAPQPFPWEIDVLGDGMYGAHGGSGLSAMGGSIRKGELLPATGAIAHALKVELWAHRLAPC